MKIWKQNIDQLRNIDNEWNRKVNWQIRLIILRNHWKYIILKILSWGII
jgi:hypothetical protein